MDELEGPAVHTHLGKIPSLFEGPSYRGVVAAYQQNAGPFNSPLRHHTEYEDLPSLRMKGERSVIENRTKLDSIFRGHVEPAGVSTKLHRVVANANKLFGDVGSSVGSTFHDKGYMSTTTRPTANVLDDFRDLSDPGDHDADLVVHTHPNAKLLSVKANGGAPFRSQHEVLVNRNSHWHVGSDAIDPKTGRRTIHLHQLEPQEPPGRISEENRFGE